jgi:two-component system, cell cycle sensor histidine kinase and response regulator CckA
MNKVLRILHLEDDPDYSDLVKEMLEQEGLRVEKVLVDNCADFITALDKDRFDVIIADYSLPAYNGLQALQTARQKCPDTPFLIISGDIGEQAAEESLKCGAADFVLKRWPERLVPAVRRAMLEIEERSHRGQAEEPLRTRERKYQEIFSATMHDITQPRSTERVLAESRGLRKAILDHIPDPAWLKDVQGRFLACNEPMARVCGLRIKDILGKTVFETIPSEAERLTREDQEVVATGKPTRVEQPFTEAGKQRRWFETIKSPIFNERGEVTGIMGISRETTERRQMEEALRFSEERFRSVWEHSIDGMCLTDREGLILATNEAFCRLVKLPREKLIGKIFSVAYEGTRQNEEIEIYRRRFEAGTIAPCLTVRKWLWNSEPLDVEISSTFIESGSQTKILFSLFRDLAERKRAEVRVAAFSQLGQQLSAAKSAREAAEIIVNVADDLFGWDACTLDLYAREKDRLLHVLSRDKINGRRVDFALAYQDEPPSPLARRTMESGGHLILKDDPQAMQPDGRAFGNTACPSAAIMLVPVRDSAKVIGLLSIHSYTPKAYDRRSLETLQALADHCAGALERISAEEALGQSEANYRLLVEHSPDAIFLHRDGTFVYANPAGLKLLGAEKPQQVLGQSVFDIVPPENRDLIRQRIRQAAEGGTTPPLEQKILRLDGTSLDAEATSIPFTHEGKPAVQSVMRDITERKAIEQQLRQSQKMEAIGQLAGGVAHDFNNMLAVIRGNAELLLMDAEHQTPEAQECLKQVTAASERAANLTRQLLAFSRKQVMQSQPLVLNDVIADLTKMLKRIIGEHIDMQCRYAAPLPFVRADAGMIEQVLLNLAVNARDAMPRGGQLLITTDTASFNAAYARTHPEACAGEFVCLMVSDTGTGITPEHLPRIFEPFFTTKELGKGTGLGLATVYGIVKQHQGWIEVASQLGAGATFKIFLPAIPTPVGTPATPRAEAGLLGGTETILLVEDDSPVRMITRRVLESQGYKICEATSVREALELWRSGAEEITLLLSDIVMPEGVMGRELAERLRAQRPGLKVVLMSGYSADLIGNDTDFCRQTKSSFLQKPFSSRVLLETVRRCLDGK